MQTSKQEESKGSKGKAVAWPTEDKLSLFRRVWEKGRASMTAADWKEEADKQGRNVKALSDQVRRKLTPDIEKSITSGQI